MKIKVKYILKKIILFCILFLKTKKILPKWFLGSLFPIYRFCEINQYSKENPDKVNFISKSTSSLNYCKTRYNYLNSENYNMVEFKYIENYAAIIHDAEIIGGSNVVILEKNKALYDLKFFDKLNKIDYNDYGIWIYNNNNLLVRKKYRESINKGIFIGGNYSFNYFHLLYEILVKFQIINRMNFDINIPLIVDKVIVDTPQYFSLLSIFNISNREIITIDKGASFRVNHLYYISCPNIIPPNLRNINQIKPEDVLFDLNTFGYLREILLKKSSKKVLYKRIFISRKKASGRRKYNEDEVFAVFEKFGFVKVFPEDYTIEDQISLFNNADFIVGGAGAALSNIIFCKEFCKSIYFAGSTIPFSGWSTIAKFVGVDMLCITPQLNDSVKNPGIHGSFKIDISKLNDMVPKWVTI